jgi:hypothetical protein
MGKIDDHRAALVGLSDWTAYLAANSGLPGPRGNLELVAACGEEADLHRADALVASGDEFATVCGLVALGRLLGEGDDRRLRVLHRHASDRRWRVREGVAMAVQRALALLDRITEELAAMHIDERSSAEVRTLRQALGYGWSVVIAAIPAAGLPAFRRLETNTDPDVAWIVRQNRKKARLKRLLRPTGGPEASVPA